MEMVSYPFSIAHFRIVRGMLPSRLSMLVAVFGCDGGSVLAVLLWNQRSSFAFSGSPTINLLVGRRGWRRMTGSSDLYLAS